MSISEKRMRRRGRLRVILTALFTVSLSGAALFFTAAGRVSAEPVPGDTAYGEAAWSYLNIIDESYPNRVSDIRVSADTSGKDSFGEWIASELRGMGYTPDTISWIHEGSQVVSYVARKPGRSERTLVIGAHYDSVATKGVDDNGTGVSLVLELAKRFKDTDTELSLDFCFWDGEETQGYAGSYSYISSYRALSDMVCYLNLDSLGAGDRMYAYGGEYDENGELVNDGPLWKAFEAAERRGIELYEMPAQIEKFPTPTRTGNSDQYYFAVYHVPYVYFEANAWITPEGQPGRTDYPQLYNSSLDCFAPTNGQIIHTTEFEDLATLEALVPGRVKEHLKSFSMLATDWILLMDEENTPETSAEETGEETAETAGAETSRESEETAETAGTETSRESEETAGAETLQESEETAGEKITESAGESTSGTEKTTAGSAARESAVTSAASSGSSAGSAGDRLPDGRDGYTGSAGHEDQNLAREAEGGDSAGAEERDTACWLLIGSAVAAGAAVIALRFAIYLRRTGKTGRKKKY